MHKTIFILSSIFILTQSAFTQSNEDIVNALKKMHFEMQKLKANMQTNQSSYETELNRINATLKDQEKIIDALRAKNKALELKLSKEADNKAVLRTEFLKLLKELDDKIDTESSNRQKSQVELFNQIKGFIKKQPVQKTVINNNIPSKYKVYTVQRGDTLFIIAKAFNCSIVKIKKMNNLRGDTIQIGQKLKVPES